MNLRFTHRPAERGSIFLLSMVIMTVLLVLGSSLIERTQTAVYRSSVESRAAKSFHLAEAGVHKALYALSIPGGWVTYGGDSSLTLPGGACEVRVSPSPTARTAIQQVTVLSTGWVPGPHGSRRYPKTIRVVARWDPNYFDFAIFGDEEVIVGNGTIDVSPDGTMADVGTNSAEVGTVVVAPQGSVTGDIAVGYGAESPPLCVDNKGIITGSIDTLDMPKFLPSLTDLPAGAISLGDVVLGGSTVLVLDEGTYHMTDLDMTGNGAIQCNGKVVIYLGTPGSASPESILIGGNGILNDSHVADNLKIYCFDNIESIAIGGNGAYYGAVYAPNSEVALNAGDVYGSLIANTVTINGSDCHVYYDESLSDESKARAVARSWEVL